MEKFFLYQCVLFIDKILKNKIFAEKREEVAKEVQHDQSSSLKPLKTKTTKAERRTLQEAQRAAKAASKGSSCETFYFAFNCADDTTYCAEVIPIYDTWLRNPWPLLQILEIAC